MGYVGNFVGRVYRVGNGDEVPGGGGLVNKATKAHEVIILVDNLIISESLDGVDWPSQEPGCDLFLLCSADGYN